MSLCVCTKKCTVCVQDLAYILATGYVAISILLSGFFVRPSTLAVKPLLWLSYVSYPRWGPAQHTCHPQHAQLDMESPHLMIPRGHQEASCSPLLLHAVTFLHGHAYSSA